MPSQMLRNAIVLGLLMAIGPFAIDMYLPALPEIGRSLGAEVGAVQASLTVFFVMLGLGQIIYGPVSDMVGRKPPLYFGLVVFVIGSIGCAFSGDVEMLVAFRALQGIGACAVSVIPRAVVRDLHTGNEAARLLSLLMLVFSVSPILAPLAGSFVIRFADWRAVFWVVGGIAVLGLFLTAFTLPETRPDTMRVDSSFRSAVRAYRVLLADPTYLGLSFIGAFGFAGFLLYLANSSFVLMDHYGLTPTQYSLAFSVNAVAFIGSAQFTSRLGRRYGLDRVAKAAVMGHAATILLLMSLYLAGIDRLEVLIALLFVSAGFLGLVLPATGVLSLEEHGAIAGTASALMGTLHMTTAAAVAAFTSLFFDGTTLPMIMGMACCAVATLVLSLATLRRSMAKPKQEAPAE